MSCTHFCYLPFDTSRQDFNQCYPYRTTRPDLEGPGPPPKMVSDIMLKGREPLERLQAKYARSKKGTFCLRAPELGPNNTSGVASSLIWGSQIG